MIMLALMCLVVFLAAMYKASASVAKVRKFRCESESCVAVVVSIQKRHVGVTTSDGGGGATIYIPTVKGTLSGGRVFEKEVGGAGNWRRRKPGDKIPILFNEKREDEIWIDSFWHIWGEVFGWILIGSISLLFVMVFAAMEIGLIPPGGL